MPCIFQVSVSCGIPDFRSRDGIYARLAVDFPDLPDPQAMFDIEYFRKDPRPFFKFAKVLQNSSCSFGLSWKSIYSHSDFLSLKLAQCLVNLAIVLWCGVRSLEKKSFWLEFRSSQKELSFTFLHFRIEFIFKEEAIFFQICTSVLTFTLSRFF